MSATALALVVGHVMLYGTARQADEGTAAHLWQLLMAAQLPVIAYEAIRWVPQSPRKGMILLAAQLIAGLAAAAPVFLLRF
jgi:hypothetical protein